MEQIEIIEVTVVINEVAFLLQTVAVNNTRYNYTILNTERKLLGPVLFRFSKALNYFPGNTVVTQLREGRQSAAIFCLYKKPYEYPIANPAKRIFTSFLIQKTTKHL